MVLSIHLHERFKWRNVGSPRGVRAPSSGKPESRSHMTRRLFCRFSFVCCEKAKVGSSATKPSPLCQHVGGPGASFQHKFPCAKPSQGHTKPRLHRYLLVGVVAAEFQRLEKKVRLGAWSPGSSAINKTRTDKTTQGM